MDRKEQPLQPVQQVVVAPPAPPAPSKEAPAAAVEPEPTAPPQAQAEPVAAPPAPMPAHRAKVRWQKGEKFEKSAEKSEETVARADPAPSPAVGAVRVTSDPPTEIAVDGRPAGVTPTTLQLSPGPHRVELREPRLRLSWAKNIEVDPLQPQTLEWRPAHGRLDVRPVPPHVELQISVDGVSVGPTPISELTVWEGTRRVTALNAATGWQVEKNVEVPANGRVRIKVNDGSGMEISPSR